MIVVGWIYFIFKDPIMIWTNELHLTFVLVQAHIVHENISLLDPW
jgi:hypothetical protein